MGYLLVDAKKLKEKGIEYFETLPDGRGIVDFSKLRVLGSISDVQVVSTAAEIEKIKQEQSKSYDVSFLKKSRKEKANE